MKIFKIIIISIFIFISFHTKAQINKKEILLASQAFILENDILKGLSHSSEITDLYSNNKVVAYLVSLKPQGYIIFTASKKVYPVFSYSEKSNFNIKQANKNQVFQSFLNNILQQIKIAETKTVKYKDVITKNKNEWNKLLNKNKNTKADIQYGYYLTNTWGGVNCWDNEGNFIYPSSYFTPNHYSPGCVAISASQILHYYQWPPVGVGSHTDNDSNGASQGSYFARFGSMFYDWDNMLNDYQGEYSTDDERRAIGRLMYHVGVAVDMDYDDQGSTSHANRVPNAFQNYFRTTGHYQTRSWSEFRNRLQANLENKMPVEFGIEADNGEAHACVCDGYRYNNGDAENDKFYHLNMGWWNWYGGNAWYKIFDSFNAVGYTIITGGVFDILPKPMMNTVERTSDYHQYKVNWHVSDNLNWEAFELQESFNNGTWATIDNNITDTVYLKTVSANGIYKYRVRAKVGGAYFSDSYSNVGVVQVGKTIFLDFDGDDSFFVNDSYNNLDVSDEWTYEAWVKVNSYNSNDWSVIMDRKTVFSLYLIDDTDADFAIRFVTRDASGNILSSLRSDNSSVNLNLGEWFHVAVSRDGTTARLFINGKLIEESTDANFVLSVSSNALNVGARYWGSYSRYLDGQIDELRFSSKAIYTENFCPNRFEVIKKDSDTRLLLNFQYGTGTALFDASRNFLGISLRSSPNLANWMTEETPIVNIQPKSTALCSGSTSFTIDAENTNNYQWQINNGSGFVNFVDNGNVTGATTNNLQLNNVSAFSEDNIIRCILSNSTTPYTCSQDAIFSVYGNCTIWDGISWSNGIPDASKSAIIDANYTSDDFLTTDNLLINETDTLFINENYTLKVEGDFFNKGTLFLKSDNANQIPGTFIHTGSIINYGNFIAQKKFEAIFSSNKENSYFISSPIKEPNSISNVFTNTPEIYENKGAISFWNLLDNSTPLEKSKPYLYQYSGNNEANFVGEFNSDSQFNNLKQIGNDDSYMFIANPYPSYINWNAANGWSKNNIEPSLYTYDIFNNGNSNNFSIWDGVVGIHGANGYIKPMEAYFVYMNNFRGSLSSTKDVCLSKEEINSTNSTPSNLIRFSFEDDNTTKTDECVLYFSDNEQKTSKPNPLSDDVFHAFFLSEGKQYAILRLNNTSMDTIVSVGFRTSTGGQITFKVTDFTFANLPVQLYDTSTDEYTSLENETTYSFTATSYEFFNRFKLYFGNYVVPVKNVEGNSKIKVWSSKNDIFIKKEGFENAHYKIYDISGKLIKEGSVTNKLTTIRNTNSGIKVVKVTSSNISKIFKLSIIK